MFDHSWIALVVSVSPPLRPGNRLIMVIRVTAMGDGHCCN